MNDTWLAYRINRGPLLVEGQAIDLYILQDAASMFIFGNVFAPHGADHPTYEEVERLLTTAYEKRDAWPSELVLPGTHGSDNSFIKVAQQNGFAVRSVPESQMSFYIKDAQEGYEEFLSRGTSDAYPFAQVERQRQASGPAPQCRYAFSVARARLPAVVAHLAQTLGVTQVHHAASRAASEPQKRSCLQACTFRGTKKPW